MQHRYTFEDLVNIMKKLRSENGCPWDREQTHKSLKQYLIEETYEVIEEIDKENKDGLCEELGDLMLQVVFHSRISEEEGQFNIDDVISGVCNKLIKRHPHVFGDGHAETAADVVNVWEKQKQKEKKQKNHTQSLQAVPAALPALMRSFKVQEKAAKVGFDWENAEGPIKKLFEEIDELEYAYKQKNVEKISEEAGDLLFTAVNVCRFLGVHPELALTDTVDKFINRFKYMEDKCRISGKNLEDLSINEMDILWEESKLHNIKKK